jgi:beta-ketoacyl synthase-like protein
LSLRARVLGVGLWMPGFPSAASWVTGGPVTGADAPNAAAQAKMRRRSSLLVNMVTDVAAQASEQAGIPLSRLRVVVGSAFGELTTLVEMLEEREGDGLLSPLRFQNSVHNSAAGQLSIAHKNKSPATSLAAGNDTVAMVLLEAMTLLALGGDEVIAIVADEPLPESICPGHETTPVAAALVLGQDAPGGAGAVLASAPPLAILEDLRQVRAAAASAERPLEVDSPCKAILPLISTLSTLSTLGLGRSGRVAVSPPEDLRWSIEVRTA